MGKIYLSLKQFARSLTLLFVVATIIYSCRKDRNDASDTELCKLKVWYENMAAKNQSEFTGLHPLWNSVYISKQNKFTVYEVALNKSNALILSMGKINVNEKASKVNLRLLLFEDNVSKKIKYASYMYVEDDNGQNIKAIHYKSFGKLTGRVLYYHQNGQMANGWIYKDGKLTAGTSSITEKQYLFMRQNKLSAKPGAKLMTETRTECEGVLAESYFWGCTSVNNSDKTCSWHYKGTSYITVCHTVRDMASDLPQDEGDGGYVPPVNYDCNGDENGSAFYTEDCGCIGGNTGIVECKKVVDVDPNARQCLKDIKTALEALGMKNTSTSSGLIASVLNKLNLSTGESFNAIIVEKTPSNPNYIAATLPPNYNDLTKSVVSEIMFNPTYLNKLTDIAVAGVMMHEYIHAYFSWNLYLMERNQQVDPKFKETYDLLFNKDGQINYSPEKDSQHEQIAKSFAGEISTMLKQYAISNQIPLPSDPEYFNKMAWAGLEKTSLYKFAPSGTYTTLAAEQGISGNKITQIIKCKQ